jgi:hypothetical protein
LYPLGLGFSNALFIQHKLKTNTRKANQQGKNTKSKASKTTTTSTTKTTKTTVNTNTKEQGKEHLACSIHAQSMYKKRKRKRKREKREKNGLGLFRG